MWYVAGFGIIGGLLFIAGGRLVMHMVMQNLRNQGWNDEAIKKQAFGK